MAKLRALYQTVGPCNFYDALRDVAQPFLNMVEDPFARGTQPCVAGEDQSADPARICLLSDALNGITLGDAEEFTDTDLMLLDGPLGGAFLEGQSLTITLETDPSADLALELRALYAARPLATGNEAVDGAWELSFVVPPAYSGRYLTLAVVGAGSSVPRSYNVSVHVGE